MNTKPLHELQRITNILANHYIESTIVDNRVYALDEVVKDGIVTTETIRVDQMTNSELLAWLGY